MKTIMNKYVENTNLQIHNTLDLMQRLGYVIYYNEPKFDKIQDQERISWNNHKGGREVSSKHFLKVDQYLKLISDNSFLAMFNDYSIIRCSFVFKNNHIMTENLLWWPCPVRPDPDMVNEFGLIETIDCILKDNETKECLLMRSPIRVDFDIDNDTEVHPKAHIHIENENTRVSTNGPICFNRFINYIVKCFYPDWTLQFHNDDYLNFQYDKKYKNTAYSNLSKFFIE